MGQASFAMLMVCTGNIGRSPMMERIMLHQLREHGADAWTSVRSAGTWAKSGSAMEPFAAHVLDERGLDATGFAATPLTEELVAGSDLVLTATREHRSRVVNLAPASVRRTFTILELQRVVRATGEVPAAGDAVAADLARAAVAWAAQMRGAVPRPAHDEDDDLLDPLGQPVDVYRARADAVGTAAEQIVPFLLGLRGSAAAG
jgi:protein-tyrosine phosphatase